MTDSVGHTGAASPPGLSEQVLGVDRALAEVARSIRLFFHVNPTNEQVERDRFLSRPSRQREPHYEYPPLAFSAAWARAQLNQAAIDTLGDDLLRRLYVDKRAELVELVELLAARGSRDFLDRSVALFGRPPDHIVRDAAAMAAQPSRDAPRDRSAAQVLELIEAYLQQYRQRYPDFDCELVLADDMSSRMYVDGSRIHVKRTASFSAQEAECDKHHEVDAHILTYLNGERQPLELFAVGLRGTLAFQESLGVFTELANGVYYPARQFDLAMRVLAVDAVARGQSFGELFAELTEKRGLTPEHAYTIAQRVFRGGGFTKDWLYVAHLERIFKYWASGRDMSLLLLGKSTLEDVDAVRCLLEGGALRPARYLPPYLERIDAARLTAPVQQLARSSRCSLGDLLSLTFAA